MNTTIQSTLLDLCQQVIEDPDRMPIIPLDVWPEGTGQQHLLTSFRGMLERLQQHYQDKLEVQERFSLAVQGANDGLWVQHLQTNQVYFSPRWKSMLGYEEDEISNTVDEWLLRLHPDDIDRVLEFGRANIAGEIDTYEIEYRLRHKDGSYRWVLSRATTLRDASGKAYRLAGSNTDITQRKLAEEELREKEEQYRSIFEASSDGLYIIDLDGFVVEANAAAYKQLGYTYKELVGMHRNVFLHPDYRLLVPEYLQVIQAGDQFQGRAVDVRKDGTLFPVEVRGKAFTYKGQPHTLSVVRDITQQVEAEQQLHEQEEQYRSIFETTTDGLVIFDLDGFIVEANPAACDVYGCTYEELIGLHISVLTHPDTLALMTETFQTIQAGSQIQNRAITLHKDGTPFYAEGHATPFTYKGKLHMLVVVRDITEQVEAEQLLEQRVEERTRELASLLEISHTVASTLQLKPLLRLILDQLQTVVDYTGASILTLEGDGLVFLDHRGPVPEEQLVQLRFPLKHLGLIWETLIAHEPILIDDVRKETPLAEAFRAAMDDLLQTTFGYIGAWMAVPLQLRDQVIGMLVLASKEEGAFTQHHATLALAIANQAAIAIENARLYEQAQELAAVEERQRLARELHDSVSQALYGISLGVHTARLQLDHDPHELGESLDYVLELAEAALTEMRALIFELRPESLETEGLVVALNKQAAALQARQAISVHTELCAEPNFSLKIKQELYRVAQEALHNTVKHAYASTVHLSLSQTSEAVILEVLDDGAGFDTTGSFPGHLGLHSMRERVTRLGGTFQIESTQGIGTHITVCVPGALNAH